MDNITKPINYQEFLASEAGKIENQSALYLQNKDTDIHSQAPQLSVILYDLQCLAKEYANFIEKLQSELNSIYSFPYPAEQICKAGIEYVKQENDIVPNIKEQIVSLSISKKRLENCLLHLSNII